MENINVLTQEKLRKLSEIKEKQINPYPHNFKKQNNIKEIIENFNNLKEEEYSKKETKIAGRIMTLRRMGKVTFIHIQDQDSKIQLYFRQDDMDKENYKFLKKIDIGDIIGAEGEIFKTKSGELSIAVKKFELLTKSLLPLPEKYHGLKNKELRYRNRHVDLIVNPETKEVFKKRSIAIKEIRNFLEEKGFMEVETPLLQTQYGGASARPFVTHINAWNMPMYLSISPELYLKRLIVGGFEKIFTICKNFRNEGVDFSHNPEFTMIEIYEAYSDYNDMMKLLEECYERVCLKINGTTKVKHNVDGKEIEIDFKTPWTKKTMSQAIKDELKIDVDSMNVKELSEFAKEKSIEISEKDTWGELVLKIFELVEEKIIQPTHIYKMPKEATPLCKANEEDSRFNNQCEPICLGMEVGNMYSEQNDPIEQENELLKQVEKGRGGDEEAHPMDTDFIDAIKTGMPPTGGIGWGIDRMIILLTGAESIRDVIFFPTMKPENIKDKN